MNTLQEKRKKKYLTSFSHENYSLKYSEIFNIRPLDSDFDDTN